MGSSLGFRPPQFSEDLEWLPPWLQHPQPEFQTPSFKPLQESIFPKPYISNVTDVDIMPSEESRHHCCHLFLSGEDNFSDSISASSGQVLHLCLRLSSDDESQCNQGQHLYTSQVLHDSTSGLSSRQLKNSASLRENMHDSKGPHICGVSKISPLTSIPTTGGNDALRCPENDEEKLDSDHDGRHLLLPTSISATVENNGLLYPSSCNNTRRECEEKSNVRHMSDGDLDDTVEISVAASEALVIHELMKSESFSEVFSSRAILEAALLVKQARLEALDLACCCAFNESGEVDSLSDLNDSIMEDAFQDVGLSLSGLDNGHEPKLVQLLTQHDKSCDDSTLGVKNNHITCLAETFQHHPAEGILHDLPLETLEVDLHSSHACIPETAEAEDNIHHPVANRFRSRWLGGWTAKEVDAPTIPKLFVEEVDASSIPKCFVETSSLSESADIAPDNNSVVEKHETFKIASQSSILFEGLQNKADEGGFLSLEFRSSNLSPIDPLCSVVPCSISSENVGSPLAKNQNDKEVEAEDCCSHKAHPRMKDLQRTSELDLGSVHVDDQVMPPGKFSGAPVRRYLASLKTYSTLLPKQDSTLEGKALPGDQQIPSECVGNLLSLDQDVGCFRVVNQGNSKGNLSFGYKFECTKGIKERQENSVIRNLVVDKSKRNRNEHGEDGSELHLQPLGRKKSPLILNKRRWCRLEGSESNPVWGMAKDSTVKFQNLQSNSKVLHNSQNPVRKRVCFPEVHTELQLCSINRASKRPKFSNSKFDSRSQDLRDCSGHIEGASILIFHGLDFLLTGYSSQKEREITRLIQKYGGFVLVDIPSPPNSREKRISNSIRQLPIVICSKKLQTTKFLYGCAVNSLILNVYWLTDSVAAGYALPPGKYMILSNQANLNCPKIQKLVRQGDWEGIFKGVGIMLHGQHNFCMKLSMIIKHGGGHVFRTFQMLLQSLDKKKTSVGAIVAEGENRASRHLKHCASERKIPVVSASWVTKSLHLGQLLPLRERWKTLLTSKRPESAGYMDWSEEI